MQIVLKQCERLTQALIQNIVSLPSSVLMTPRTYAADH